MNTQKGRTVISGNYQVPHYRHDMADGTVAYLEHRDVYVAYMDGRIICTRKTAEGVKKYLQANYTGLPAKIRVKTLKAEMN